MRDYGGNIKTGFQHDGHLVPRLVHLTSVDSLDREHVEYDLMPIDGHFFRRDAEHRDLSAMAHVGEHLAEGRWIARHLETDIEAFLHAELLLRGRNGGFLGVDGERGAHFAGELQP